MRSFTADVKRGVYIYASYPLDDDTWTVSAIEESLPAPTTWDATAWAICASV